MSVDMPYSVEMCSSQKTAEIDYGQLVIFFKSKPALGIMLADRDLTERSGEIRVNLFSGDVISEPMRFKVEKRFIKQSQMAPK